MDIVKAQSEADWVKASEILVRVVENLNKLERTLWTKEQVSVEGLKKAYKFSELHLLIEKKLVGVVFLQNLDPFFWPEVHERNSLFVHKLAIEPSFAGSGLGVSAMEAVIREADDRGLSWVRLDCDDRPELHRFYQNCGFELVDVKEIDVYQVARYQLLTNAGKPCCEP